MRNALSIGSGHWGVFVERPLSLGLLVLLAVVLVLPRLWRWYATKRQIAGQAQASA
jgi:putative tricarboxylic transport membrane protein